MSHVLADAAALSAERRPFVLATVVWRRAPTSGKPGAHAIVLPDGSVRGWVGGACAQPTLVRQAMEVLAAEEPRLVYLGPAEDYDGALREGVVRVPMACESEGALEIYLEPVVPAPRVVVVGDSALTVTLGRLVADVGWEVTVVDDVAEVGAGETPAAVVVATQGRYDEDAALAALATGAAYVGIVASRRRAETLVDALRALGADDHALARVRVPAGLDLGSVDHTEIAVAVLAELVHLRARGELRGAAAVPRQRPVEALDPVCGMTVDVAAARHVSTHAGARFYFCAASCKRTFDGDPEKYVADGPGAVTAAT